jgi:hypothetical protein
MEVEHLIKILLFQFISIPFYEPQLKLCFLIKACVTAEFIQLVIQRILFQLEFDSQSQQNIFQKFEDKNKNYKLNEPLLYRFFKILL